MQGPRLGDRRAHLLIRSFPTHPSTKWLVVFALLVFGVLFPLSQAQGCFGGYMAKIIEFYVPQSFRKVSKWVPTAERGKVLAFPQAVRKSA